MLRALFFVALFVGILCSCGGDPIAGAGSRGGETGGQSSEGRPPEETSSRRVIPADEETPAPAPTRLADEPEPPENNTVSSSTPTRPALGTNGMVSSAHPLATRAGLEVLEDGGNAFDAAVAVAASLGVVEPYMSGVGGSGTMVVYDAQTGETRSLSAASRAPESLDPGVFPAPPPT